jgi:hypothetical protein
MFMPYRAKIDLNAVLPSLLEIAANADGNRDVLDAVLRLAVAFGIATAPSEAEALAAKRIDEMFARGRAIQEQAASRDLRIDHAIDRYKDITK